MQVLASGAAGVRQGKNSLLDILWALSIQCDAVRPYKWISDIPKANGVYSSRLHNILKNA